nr:hypothetical protein [Tanacetum cinerariifolium]
VTTPKPKASGWKTRSSSDTTITPPTAAAAMKEAQQLKLVTTRSLQQIHITQASGSGAYEGTGYIPGVPDVPTDESEEELSWNSTDEEGDDDDDDQEVDRDDEKDEGSDDEQASDEEEFIHSSLSTHAEEEPRDEESFDSIRKTPEDTNDEGNGEENLRLNVGMEEGHDEEEEEDELYRDVNINQGRDQRMNEAVQVAVQIQSDHLYDEAQANNVEFLKTIDENMKKIIKEQTLEANFSEFMQTNLFAGAVSAIPEIVQRYIDQRMNEAVQVAVQIQSDHLYNEAQANNVEFLKTIDENMKKIIKEQRNLYKALVKAYESDNIILDTYGETVTLKRRHDDDADKDKEPSAGPNRGSKRRREGNEPESASDLQETATTSAGRSTQGSQSQQTSASEFAAPEEPMQTTFEMEEPAHPEFEIGADDQPINKDKQNRLMRIDELHKFSDVTLTNVHTALDDHLKGIRMQYLPQSIWRKSDKDRAEAMIQAIDKRLKTRRIMRSLERKMPAGIRANAHGEVGRGVLVLFWCRCVYRRVSCREGVVLAGNL